MERFFNLTQESRTLKLENKLGLHARAAAAFVKVVNQFKSKISVEYRGQLVSGESILDLLTLSCSKGETLLVRAEGPDAVPALNELEKLVKNKFGEEA